MFGITAFSQAPFSDFVAVTDVSLVIVESVTASDAATLTVIYASVITESGTVTSSQNAGYTYVDSIIEYANALDTVMRIQKWYPVTPTSTTWSDTSLESTTWTDKSDASTVWTDEPVLTD